MAPWPAAGRKLEADGPGSTAKAEQIRLRAAGLNIDAESGGVLRAYHFVPKAKRSILLFMSGGPSQLDLFD